MLNQPCTALPCTTASGSHKRARLRLFRDEVPATANAASHLTASSSDQTKRRRTQSSSESHSALAPPSPLAAEFLAAGAAASVSLSCKTSVYVSWRFVSGKVLDSCDIAHAETECGSSCPNEGGP